MSIYGGVGSPDWRNPTPIRLGQTSVDTPNWLLPDAPADDPNFIRWPSLPKVAWWRYVPEKDGWVNFAHYTVYADTGERVEISWTGIGVHDANYQVLNTSIEVTQVPVKAGEVYNIAVSSVSDTHYGYNGHPDCRFIFHLVLQEMGSVIPQIHWPDKPAVTSSRRDGYFECYTPRLVPLTRGRCLALWWQYNYDEQYSYTPTGSSYVFHSAPWRLKGRVVYEDSSMGPEETIRSIGRPLSDGMWLNWTAQWIAELGDGRVVSLTNMYNDDLCWRTMTLLRVNDDDTIDFLDSYDTDNLGGTDDGQSALSQAGPGAAVLYSYVPDTSPSQYTIHRVTAAGDKLVIGPANPCPPNTSNQDGAFPRGLWSNGKVGVMFTRRNNTPEPKIAYCFTMSGDQITMQDGTSITGWVDRGYDLSAMDLPEGYVADGPRGNQMISSTNNSFGFSLGLLETDGERCWIIRDINQDWDDDSAWLFDWGRWLPRATNKNTGKTLWFWAVDDLDWRPTCIYDPFSGSLPYYSARMPIFDDPDYTEMWGDKETFSPYVWERDAAAATEGSGYWLATASNMYPGDQPDADSNMVAVMYVSVTPDIDGGPIDDRRAFKARP